MQTVQYMNEKYAKYQFLKNAHMEQGDGLPRYVRLAMNFLNEHNFDPILEYHHTAIIVRGGKILSVGFNRINTTSYMEYLMDRVKGLRDYCGSVHAEVNAITRVRNKTDLTGAKMIVVRKCHDKSMGEYAMSRPCIACTYCLHRHNIKKITYSIDQNHVGYMTIGKDHTDLSDKIIRC